jgi:hypothetical protein
VKLGVRVVQHSHFFSVRLWLNDTFLRGPLGESAAKPVVSSVVKERDVKQDPPVSARELKDCYSRRKFAVTLLRRFCVS